VVLKGKYQLEALLGCGGMAAVYRATHRNGNRVAVKILHPELSMSEDVRARFLREGYVANRVQHKGAVRVLDDDVDDDVVFLVMELLEGETLEARWTRSGRHLLPDDVAHWATALLETLGAAHAQGIVHRDVKPENLFLTTDGDLKVLDFGIARLLDAKGAHVTRTGRLMGTPAFLPPEQALGYVHDVDARSDLFAVGATMFTLLAGRYVHEANGGGDARLRGDAASRATA
jgi:serine/threonine-protein kinase